jgi:hypothetical protein
MNRSIATPMSDPSPDQQFLLWTLPPNRQQKRFTLWVLLVLLVALLITAPFRALRAAGHQTNHVA